MHQLSAITNQMRLGTRWRCWYCRQIYSITMYIMHLDVTHQHSDEKSKMGSTKSQPNFFLRGAPDSHPAKMDHENHIMKLNKQKQMSFFIYNIYIYIYTSSLGQENNFFGPAFVTRLLTPRSRKSDYGLLLGVDQDQTLDLILKKLFLTNFDPQNRENLHSLFWSKVAIDRAWSTQSGGSP